MHSTFTIEGPAPGGQAGQSWRSTALGALGGPVALGAILGLEVGPLSALARAMILPVMLAGVAAVMVPAMYISATITGVAPPARDMARSLGRGFRACGLGMLGLAAPALFLLGTTQTADVAAVVGGGATAAGALVGLRVLFADLFESGPLRARCAFGVWALVALIMGMRLYAEFVA